MDSESLTDTVTRQVAAVGDAPIPFFVAMLIALVLIWKAMGWRYDSIIAKLREEVIYLEKAVTRPKAEPGPSEPRVEPQAPALTAVDAAMAFGPPPPEREFLPASITPKFIAELSEGLTRLQADRITGSYVGKWMRVSGTVYDVSAGGWGTVMISIYPDDAANEFEAITRSIAVVFDKDDLSLDHLKRDDHVACIGEIQSIGGLGITLVHGELVD